jgi:hypothetical protein
MSHAPWTVQPHTRRGWPHQPADQPLGSIAYDASKGALTFDPELLHDFYGAKAGDPVQVELYLFGPDEGSIHIISYDVPERCSASVRLPVQLLLGHTFSDVAALEGFLARPAP